VNREHGKILRGNWTRVLIENAVFVVSLCKHPGGRKRETSSRIGSGRLGQKQRKSEIAQEKKSRSRRSLGEDKGSSPLGIVEGRGPRGNLRRDYPRPSGHTEGGGGVDQGK